MIQIQNPIPHRVPETLTIPALSPMAKPVEYDDDDDEEVSSSSEEQEDQSDAGGLESEEEEAGGADGDGEEEVDEDEIEPVTSANEENDGGAAAESQSTEDDEAPASAWEDDEAEDTAGNPVVGKRERARLKELQKLKEQNIQEILDSQNASIDADMNTKGNLLQQTEIFAHFAKAGQSKEKKSRGRGRHESKMTEEEEDALAGSGGTRLLTQPSSEFLPVEQVSATPTSRASNVGQKGLVTNEGVQQEEAVDCQIMQSTEQQGGRDCCDKLKRDYNSLLREKGECVRLLEDLMRENELKKKECHQAQTSMHELQMELRRKSMHVDSLASAVVGRVEERSRWHQLSEDLGEKFKALKTEHQALKTDATQMMNQYASLEFKDLKERFSEEPKERKDLYNKHIDLKGNIRVFCRCRPLNTKEIAEGAMAVDFESAKDGELIVRGSKFKFDSVFLPEEDQEKVFEKTAPFATSVLDGYNVCIFAYGPTGTSKTFTMEGTEGARGVNYRILDELFRVIKDRHGLFQYEITVSSLEVYNEQIHDLLLTGSQPGAKAKRLEVRQVAEGVHHVPGLVEERVTSMDEAWEVLKTGSKARVVGSTNANEHSSRSHCMHCVMVKGENMMNGDIANSKLWLIDLAGSERVAKTDARGDRLKEAQNINKSLSALGDVMFSLATKSPHIPFRNSKLTQLLQDSLSGDSKTLMFVHISPNENDVGETLCSLNFASRVRGIKLGQARKQVDVGELSRYKLMVGRAKQDCKSKDTQIKSMEETIKAKELLIMNLQYKIKELESQLLVDSKLARQHVDNRIAQDVERKQQEQQSLKEENNSYPRSPMLERNLNSTTARSRSKRNNRILPRSLQKKVGIRSRMTAKRAGRSGAGATAAQGVDSARRAAVAAGTQRAGHHHNRDKERVWRS